jgi:hypothetical protein
MAAFPTIGQLVRPSARRIRARVRRLYAPLALTVYASCRASASWAAEPDESTSSSEVQAALSDAARLERTGAAESAVELLKRAYHLHPGEERLVLALAQAYAADHNDFWALNVLSDFVATHPPACQARAFAAWTEVRQANLDQALEMLQAPECLTRPELRARFLLLRAMVADVRGERDRVSALLAEVRSAHAIYAEDETLLAHLAARYQRGRLPLVAGETGIEVGYATNGMANSPVDLETPRQSMASPVGLVDARVRAVLPASDRMRPVVESGVEVERLSDAASDLSYQHVSWRAGLLLGYERPRLLLSYVGDAAATRAGETETARDPWYSVAHRAHYELEASESWFAFGAVGYRGIREQERSRVEVEQGLAFSTRLTTAVALAAGASARGYEADLDAYDQLGATAFARLDIALPQPFVLREAVSVAGDDFPLSEGFFASALGRERRDLTVRTAAGLWASLGQSLQTGVEYAYTNRDSTAHDFAFADHRVLLRWTATLDSDRLLTRVISPEGRVPLETGKTAMGRLQESGPTVRELMRQNEAAQRGSSCLK